MHGYWNRIVRAIRTRAVLLTALLATGMAQGADSLDWRSGQNRVSASIESWTLPTLLESIGAASGWEIYVEPNTDRPVTARFKNLPVGEALQRLLGSLNFALLPRTNAPARLFIYRTSLQEATQLVKVRKKGARDQDGKAIGDELVLTMKPGANAEDIARRLGGKIAGRIGESGVYRLKFDDEAAAQRARELAKDLSDQVSVDDNYIMQRPPQAEMLAASSAPPFSLNPSVGGDGSKLIVGLIDTAMQPLGAKFDQFILPSLSVFGDFSPASADQIGHGPAMAETILKGLATILESGNSTVRVLPVDVYGGSANTTSFDVAKGISMAVEAGATVINLSLGGESNPAYLQTIIQNAAKQGVLFVAAAGNEPVSTPYYPAAYPDVLAVTAGDRQGNIASYANYGAFVDVVAPGAAIVYYKGQAYFVSGTSASAALVSGMAAGLANKSGASLTDISAQIRKVLAAPASKP